MVLYCKCIYRVVGAWDINRQVVIWRHCEALLWLRMSDHGAPPPSNTLLATHFGQTESADLFMHECVWPHHHKHKRAVKAKGPSRARQRARQGPDDPGRYIKGKETPEQMYA